MTRNLRMFIGLTVLATAAYMAIEDGISLLPSGAQGLASFAMFILFVYVVFDLVVKVIYRLSGATSKLMEKPLPRLNHNQAAEVNRYWIAWLASSITTDIIYTLLFQPRQWKSAIFGGVILAAIVGLVIVNSRQKIAGHTKKEIFK